MCREGTLRMKELTAREVQLGELEIVKKLDEICTRLNLRYFLAYGTLIGAIRHQGFIPWDDDLDIMLPRKDYEILLEYLMTHEQEVAPLTLMHYKTNKKYIYPIARVVDTRYWVDYQNAKDYDLGLFVDVYPLDGCGNTEEEAAQILKKNYTNCMMVSLAGERHYRPSISGGFVHSVGKYAAYCYAQLFGARYFAKKLDASGKKYAYDDSKYVDLTIWDANTKPFLREWFQNVELVKFEDAMLCVPTHYHEILTQTYGDYMALPPEEERIGHHYYTAYLREENDCV